MVSGVAVSAKRCRDWSAPSTDTEPTVRRKAGKGSVSPDSGTNKRGIGV